jgi:hypothetical protein
MARVVAEAVVVVLHRDQRVSPLHVDGAAPGVGERTDDVGEEKLNGVRAGSRIGEVAGIEGRDEVACRDQGGWVWDTPADGPGAG